uniref:Defensin-like protein 158 family n=1 Tax=Cajanus cajan TaxID=3821 RepID=A0A151SMH2_CAJCA|nr:Putative defensin-like protein 158 family [Cajanus cajan]
MAKISFTIIFTLVLILTVIERTSGDKTDNQCSTILDPNGCNLSACRSKCQQLHSDGTGFCVDVFPHKCICFYNCPI